MAGISTGSITFKTETLPDNDLYLTLEIQ